MDASPIVLAAAVTGGSLGILHFALRPEETGYKLPRPVAYAIGLGVIVAVTSWLGLLYAVTPLDVLRLLWVSTAAAGAVTLGGRLWRAFWDGLHARRERDEALRSRRER